MTAAQLRAADPRQSAWVSASAGTGKTKVLTDRVLRAMLAGTPPARILCLTFTRAAAAEMSNRLHERLAEWAVMPQEKLAVALGELMGAAARDDQIDRARRLFAAVLDAPGGLKIMTIHAFCQSLVARFPLEAGIPPHFKLAEERMADELLHEAREEVLQAARWDGGGPARLREALARVTTLVDEGRFGELMAALIRERGRLQRLLSAKHGVMGIVKALAARLGVDADATAESVVTEAVADGAFDAVKLKRAADALSRGSKTDVSRSEIISAWLSCDPNMRGQNFKECLKAYFTQKGPPFKTFATKQAVVVWAEVEEVLRTEAGRLARVLERHNAAATLRATEAVLILAEAIFDRYERRKRAIGALDYDDLILAAVELLERPGSAPWVLYKLDGGLDHILVDEAQDTNPEQWSVVTALAAEFFAGAGAREVARTVFAVGDPKQSIFSFQRADPARFAATREALESAAHAADLGWESVALELSFRSTESVLRAVDAVFARDAAKDGVVGTDESVHHEAHRKGQAGLVEVWPIAEPVDGATTVPWALPVSRPAPPAPRLRVARAIARRVRDWITADAKQGDEAWLDSKARRVRAGDILVLVRRRGDFVEELVRELKALDVPVAGVDRMVLAEQLAVMDLIALGETLLLPDDDLTLATVLKGPLIGLSEEDLFDLAHGRDGKLWDALQARAGERGLFGAAFAFLAELRARVDFVRPYELYADLLNRGGRQKLLARLGTEAADPIEEFLSLALSYERVCPPSLQGFLHWVRAGAAEVKRELDRAEGAVRVMTVHGAKGLQAPIVFLPDTLQPPTQDEALLWPDGLLLWPPRKALEDPFSAAMRAASRVERDREYRRLLYVAMTRAEDRLYVAGWRGGKAPPSGNWYELVRAGLEPVAEKVAFPDGEGLRLSNAQSAKPEGAARAAFVTRAVEPVPDWIGRPPPPEPIPSRPLAPSRPSADEPAVQSPLAGDDGARFRRGLIVHRLLQTLPDLEPAARAAAARRYLAQGGLGLDEAARASLAQEALRLLDAPGFARLFGSGSRAEVPLIGRLNETVVVGQVDRLIVDAAGILVADYKTNRPPPKRVEDVSPLYLRQMACYRALLQQIYPGRLVECALVWTDGPDFMMIPNGLMDVHAP
ncbi:MAG: double-strand break repair helicase AddA [Alphaproteobacteria bacterium]